jgi:DNA-binding MarR family transcriptional regulator
MPNRPSLPPDFDTRYPESSRRATECAMNLVSTADQLVGKISKLLRPYHLSPSAALALGILADSLEPLPPHAIADRLILTRATMTGLVDSLERRNYANRQPHPTDRRMVLIEITDLGRRVTGEFRRLIHRHQHTWLRSLTAADKGRLLSYLHQIQDGLEDRPA